MTRPWIEGRREARLEAPAVERNRAPIMAVLERHLPRRGLVLELGSGTGQHLAWFAAHTPELVWQPSDPDPEMHPSIAAWCADAGLTNVLPPLAIDAGAADWPLGARAGELVAIVCINVLQVAPRGTAEGLMAGAGRLLPAGGVLYLYGPFTRDGVHTAPSNQAFDRMLRAYDPAWGVPDLDGVARLAEAAGLDLAEVAEMPANNLSAVFRRR